jgi:molecular chaperone GrpE
VAENNETISEELEQETDEAVENADIINEPEEDSASAQKAVEDGTDGEESETEEEEKESAKEGKEKKSFFKKKKDKKDEQIEELQDRLVRNLAEFENFRNRSEKEKTQMFEIGAKNIIEKILPVLDNFERGLGTVSEEEKDSAFVQGIEQIYKQFVKALEDAGVKPIEAVGQEFNPEFHNAVMHGEDEELGENVVAEEFQKGYMYKDTVVRHSMVKVVN